MISRIYLSALFTCMVSFMLIRSDEKNENACKTFGTNPNFDHQMLLGPQWRVYYTWNERGKADCLAMTFYSINTWLVGRFYRDMGQYLMEQPLWSAAILYVAIGPSKEQMLLFNDTGPEGRVHGVPNLIRDPTFMKQKIPLLQFQMKLLEGGKYLVILDCLGGRATLSKSDLEEPFRTEIESVAEKLSFGKGSMTCKTKEM